MDKEQKSKAKKVYIDKEQKSKEKVNRVALGLLMRKIGWLFQAENYHVFLRMVAVILAGIHLLLYIWFELVGLHELTAFHYVSWAVYLVCIGLTFKKKYTYTVFILLCLEVMVFEFFMIYHIEDTCLFRIYTIALLPFAFVTKYVTNINYMEGKYQVPFYGHVPNIIGNILFFIGMGIMDFTKEGRIVLENTVMVTALLVINLTIVVGSIIIGCSALSSIAEEHVIRLQSNLREVEELKKIAETANRSKTQFLANMSHEIRTPMNAICGMADFLLDEDLSEKAREYTATIQSAGSHLLHIINDILDFSKIESGRMELIEDTYSVNGVIQDIMNMMMIRVRNKPIQMRLEAEDDVPKKLWGDKSRIRQIIINLMNNAIKFTDRGTVTLSVEFKNEMPDVEKPELEPVKGQDGDGYLHICVTDTGRGIRKEDCQKLFRAFEQVDLQRNRDIEGTGLGLSICKLLVESMNGKIWVESEYEKGSSFHFYIYQWVMNRAPSNFNKDPYQSKAKKSVQKFEVVNARVMVVDDNRVNVKVASGMLRRFGIEALEVGSGIEAVEIMKQGEKFDIIFMDHLMPEMDGIEATKCIREISDYTAGELKIIALSANAVNGMEQQFLDAGMNDFLAKPMENDKLAEMLKKWLPENRIHYLS